MQLLMLWHQLLRRPFSSDLLSALKAPFQELPQMVFFRPFRTASNSFRKMP
nr:MAG TPA: hypothetical protein [Caudoviricetes sp.]